MAEESAKSIHKAFEGIGTDESRLIKEIVNHSNSQRQQIKQHYKTMYGRTLEEDVKKELSGNFEKAVLALLEPVDEYEARQLRNAVHGIGTNENVVIQILCSKEAHEIANLKAAYERLFHSSLDNDLKDEEGGPLGKIFRSIASGKRASGSLVDYNLAKTEAQALYDAGEGTFGTNDSEFVRILCSRSFPQLRATFQQYETISENNIEQAIKKEMSGNLERACLAIVESVKNKTVYYAKQLHEAMAGIGTKEDDLTRLLVTRLENDMNEIKRNYQSLFGKSLYDAIKSELSGDSEKLFLALVGK